MSLRLLLVIEKKRNTELRHALRRRGFAPVGVPNMRTALQKVKGGNVAGILVPRRQPGLDVLELVLNIRDVDSSMPILIVSGATEMENTLVAVGRAVLLGRAERPECVATEVEQVLAGYGGESEWQTPPAEERYE
jgi:DNA-binding NtrC family response regulator